MSKLIKILSKITVVAGFATMIGAGIWGGYQIGYEDGYEKGRYASGEQKKNKKYTRAEEKKSFVDEWIEEQEKKKNKEKSEYSKYQKDHFIPKRIGERYAVVCTGASLRDESEELRDPIDKNCFWISAVRVYNELLKSGYKPENVYVLYKDGKPPFDDEEFLDQIKEIKKEFNGSYPNIATSNRLEDLLDSLEDKIKSGDEFTLYLNMHGGGGRIYFEHNNSSLSAGGLDYILKGIRSRNILILVGSCYAEDFTEDIKHNSILIAASKRDRVGWGDRNFSCGSWFFAEMNNRDNDFNKDGQISPYEAFVTTKERCIKYRMKIDEFLRNEYKPSFGDKNFLEELEGMDFVPVYRENKK